jgi:hypothetical protein
MTETCPSCGQQGIRRLRSHLSRNAFCARAFYSPEDSNGETEAGPSIYPPIPAVINTSHASPQLPDNAQGTSERTNSYRSRLRTRETPLNYAESARKRGCTSDPDDGFPTPDEDLGDYISTFFDTDDQPESVPPPDVNPRTTRLHPGQENQQDMLELAVDTWTSLYGGSVREESHSVAAVALPPGNVPQSHDNNLPAIPPLPAMADSRLGTFKTVTMEEQNSRIVATPQDRSMARIYRLCDDAGSPRYLADAIIRQIRNEMVLNDFDPCHSGITLRDAFMHRASKSIGSRPPEAIPITLESGQKVTVFRFPFLQSFQEHLLSAPFSDIRNLSVDAANPWGSYSSDDDVF